MSDGRWKKTLKWYSACIKIRKERNIVSKTAKLTPVLIIYVHQIRISQVKQSPNMSRVKTTYRYNTSTYSIGIWKSLISMLLLLLKKKNAKVWFKRP